MNIKMLKVFEKPADIEVMENFINKIKSKFNTPELPDNGNDVPKNDTVKMDSVFLKKDIDFQNEDTIVKQKTSEELIIEELKTTLSHKNSETTPEQEQLRKKLLKETGREFSQESLDLLEGITAEKIQLAKKIINIDREQSLTENDLTFLLLADDISENDLPKLEKLINMKEREFGFSGSELCLLSKLSDEEIERVRELSSVPDRMAKFNAKELSLLAKMPENILDSILQKNPDIQIDKISSDCLSFETYNSDETRIYEIFDTKLKKFVEKQTVEINGDKITETIENTQNNIKQKIVSDRYNSVIEDEQIFRYDKNGELLSVEHLRKNDGIVGQNASLTDKNGKIYPLQRENFDNETGIKSVEKNFTSPDGTRTEYFYEEMPDGSRISEYKIIDTNGNVLLNEHTIFAPLKADKNKFVSSRNGFVYEIEHRNDRIIVTDKTKNRTAEIDINKLTGSKPENFLRVLKQLSGDYLMRIAENPIKLEEAEFDPGLWGNESKVLYLGVSEWFSGDEEKFSVFLHELGHYIDTEKIGDDFGIYSGNRELNEIFKKEIENFKKHSTTKQQMFIDYFIGDRGKSSAAETFAESNMLLSTPYSTRRAYYLQQNFPRTIAKIAELIKSDLQ